MGILHKVKFFREYRSNKLNKNSSTHRGKYKAYQRLNSTFASNCRHWIQAPGTRLFRPLDLLWRLNLCDQVLKKTAAITYKPSYGS